MCLYFENNNMLMNNLNKIKQKNVGCTAKQYETILII